MGFMSTDRSIQHLLQILQYNDPDFPKLWPGLRADFIDDQHKQVSLLKELLLVGESKPLYCVLRDLSTSIVIQEKVRELGFIPKAMERVLEGKEFAPTALQFLSNCISGDAPEANRALLWELFDFEICYDKEARASSSILFVCCTKGTGSFSRCESLLETNLIRMMLSIIRDIRTDPDSSSWIGWTLCRMALVLDSRFLTQLEQPWQVEAVVDEIDHEEETFPITFACSLVSMLDPSLSTSQVSALDKLAQWTEAHPLTIDSAKGVLLCCLYVLQSARSAVWRNELTTGALRVLCNVIARNDVALCQYVVENGGLPTILENTKFDPNCATRREWALMSVRELCAGSRDAQDIISSMSNLDSKPPWRG